MRGELFAAGDRARGWLRWRSSCSRVRFSKRVPGSIVALIGRDDRRAGVGLNVETIGTRFGGIPTGLPHFALPDFRPDLLPGLLAPAVTVAMLGAIESLLSAIVADRMSGDRHNPNVELFAQGIANIVSPLFGGLPATGAIARTATNIRSGAKTPVAGMVHALTMLAVLLWAAPLAKIHSARRAGRDPDGRRLQHGRVAGDSEAAEADARPTSPSGW